MELTTINPCRIRPGVSVADLLINILNDFDKLNTFRSNEKEDTENFIPLRLLKAIKEVIEAKKSIDDYNELEDADIVSVLLQLKNHPAATAEIKASIDDLLKPPTKVLWNWTTEKPALEGMSIDILGRLIASSESDYLIVAITLARTCRPLAEKMGYCLLNDKGRRLASMDNVSSLTRFNQSLEFHFRPPTFLLQSREGLRFLLQSREGLRFLREHGVDCGPKTRQEMIKGNCTFVQAKQKTQNASQNFSTKLADALKTRTPLTSRALTVFREMLSKESFTTALNMIKKYMADDSLDMFTVVYFINMRADEAFFNKIAALQDCIDLEEIDLNYYPPLTELNDPFCCFVPSQQNKVGDTLYGGSRSPLLDALSIPFILDCFKEGKLPYKEFYDTLISNNRNFTMRKERSESYLPSRSRPGIKWDGNQLDFNFAQVLECPLVQTGLKQGVTLAELTSLPEVAVYRLMFDGTLRNALGGNEPKLTLKDVISQDSAYSNNISPEKNLPKKKDSEHCIIS